MKPDLSGAVYIPKSEFSVALRKTLTVKKYTPGEDTPKVVQAWTEDRKGYVGIPRHFGLYLLGVDHDEHISPGYKLPKLQSIALWDYQEPWVEEVVEKAGYWYDFRAMAATGKGKTVMALEVIRRLGATALVIVDQNFLKDQWIARIQEFLGIPKSKIGVIQGNVCDYEDKYIVVAMIQTLFQKKYPEEVYDYFGTIIVDEAHIAGAPMFSRALMQFPAQNRIGISATPHRNDNLEKILEWNLGPVIVELKEKHKKSAVRYLESPGVYTWYANISPKTGRFISELVADGKRNALICEAILWLWESGRHVLAVSDRIEHLESLMALCTCLGLPSEEMGIVAGYTHKWRMVKDPEPCRKPDHLHKNAPYTPVILQKVKTRTPKAVLESTKNNKQVIFATYSMFSKGVDIPRLSAGIDCTSRTKAQQVHGRILRSLDGKLRPIWVTIRDINSFRAEYQFSERVLEYQKSNAEIFLWRLGKGVKKREHKKLSLQAKARSQELKGKQIETQSDGKNTIKTKTIARK